MILFSLLCSAFADQVDWSDDTAHTLPEGRWEVGLFGPLRYGWSESLEIEIHPLWALVSPHLAVKKDLLEFGRWSIAARQSIAYPTLLLRGLARGGIGGIMPPDSEIPHIISSDTRLLATKDYSEKASVTMRLQLNVAPRFGTSDFPHIPVPVVYPRLASYQGVATVGAGTFMRCEMTDGLEVRTDTQLWFMAGNEGNWAVEQWASLRWFAGSKFSVDAGVVGTIGAYPYGQEWHLVPTFDLNWAID
jgi:hypothetical protein